MKIRIANLNDIDLLVKLRIDYIKDGNGDLSKTTLENLTEQLKKYLPTHIKNGQFIGILAEEDGAVLSTAYIAISEKPAGLVNLNGKVAMLLNVFTYPKYRHKGFATKVIEIAIKECCKLDISSIELSATPYGKPLYEKLGFRTSNYPYMRLLL